MGNGASKCEWRHAPEEHWGFGGFWKSQLVELRPASGDDGWLSLARGGHGQMWGRWKSQNRKNVFISTYVEEPFYSIKSFVLELRSRKCFSCFGIPMFYVYVCYEHFMYILHIQVYGYGTRIFPLNGRCQDFQSSTNRVASDLYPRPSILVLFCLFCLMAYQHL